MRGRPGYADAIDHETEITRPEPPLGPPPGLLNDVWPWLAALGGLAVAALLVWLFVLNGGSNGGQVVPGVVGLQQQQAIARLTGDGFNVRAIVGASAKPRGIVVAQEPGGGSRLDRGQTVVLHISSGRAVRNTTTTAPTRTRATTTVPPPTATVPGVTGQDAAAGAGQVEAAGFVAQTDPVDAAAAAGAIVAQDPAAGGTAEAGSVVRLAVAVGTDRPAQQVPDVVGRSAGDARAALLESKLTVRTAYRSGRRGVVLAQSPAAGTTAPAYTQVTIAVGR